MRAPEDKLSSSGRTLARFLLCPQLPIVRVAGSQVAEHFVFSNRVQRYEQHPIWRKKNLSCQIGRLNLSGIYIFG